MTFDLDAYLQRIGYSGPVAPTREVLFDVHRRHLRAIPYENLDIHLGRGLPLDVAATYDKIVQRRRGGWCYEMNGLLAWALSEMGFSVRLLASDVGTPGDHLLLLVALDHPYLADVGFGNGLYEPVPLRAGDHAQNGFVYRLEPEGSRWRFVNQPTAGDSFVFDLAPRELADFAERCQWLQTSPDSGFVRNVACHRFSDDGRIFSLRGAVLTTYRGPDKTSRTLADADDFTTTLRDTFLLDLPEATGLWTAILARHAAWRATQA